MVINNNSQGYFFLIHKLSRTRAFVVYCLNIQALLCLHHITQTQKQPNYWVYKASLGFTMHKLSGPWIKAQRNHTESTLVWFAFGSIQSGLSSKTMSQQWDHLECWKSPSVKMPLENNVALPSVEISFQGIGGYMKAAFWIWSLMSSSSLKGKVPLRLTYMMTPTDHMSKERL